ncbi:hypothetical protein D9611_006745 [Ephemerocybe angulata]|uniref:Uncharacterized protein n=1 Tax=Ephemerocybe angulata TaxID=980116 RepID=A0A8H5FHD9_9AGAR|nr:hypothetical protein D9611_006745 [Tulosesus angulatus]
MLSRHLSSNSGPRSLDSSKFVNTIRRLVFYLPFDAHFQERWRDFYSMDLRSHMQDELPAQLTPLVELRVTLVSHLLLSHIRLSFWLSLKLPSVPHPTANMKLRATALSIVAITRVTAVPTAESAGPWSNAQLDHWIATTEAKLTFIGVEDRSVNPLKGIDQDSQTSSDAVAIRVVYCSQRSGNTCAGLKKHSVLLNAQLCRPLHPVGELYSESE